MSTFQTLNFGPHPFSNAGEHMTRRPRFECKYCGSIFARTHNLNVHIISVHNGGRDFACTHAGCFKAYRRQHDLTRHMLRPHEPGLATQEEQHYEQERGLRVGVEGRVEEVLQRLLCLRIGHPLSIISTTRNSSQLLDFGPDPFATPSGHTTVPRIECEHCSMMFARRHNLRAHIASVHNSRRSFACTYAGCSMTCSRRRDLMRHVQLRHMDPVSLPRARAQRPRMSQGRPGGLVS